MANAKGGLKGAAGGAGTGAALGSFIPGIGTGIGAAVGGIIGGIGGLFGGDDDEKEREYQEQMRQLREQSKARQMGYVDSLKGPSMSPEMERRLKILDDESKHTSLVEDPYFQGQRATLVHGGQEALSSVQNNQAATGATGGFQNVGSINDVYDRMGSELANLGQQSTELKDKKSQAVADARQALVDAQVEHDNAVLQAKLSIEQGDFASAQAAMNAAYQAKQKADAANQAMWGSMLSTAGTIGAAALGKKASTTTTDSTAERQPAPPSQDTGSYGATYDMPTFASLRRGIA